MTRCPRVTLPSLAVFLLVPLLAGSPTWAQGSAPASVTGPAAAASSGGWAPSAVMLEAGRLGRGGTELGVGLRWPWAWRSERGAFSGATELLVSRWTIDGRGFTQLAAVPVVRWRPGQGSSAWFVEGGIGLSLHNRIYETDDARMSTRLNFYDTLAVGRSFQGGHELSLRLVHVSNAGIRRPNPGEEVLMLRYTVGF